MTSASASTFSSSSMTVFSGGSASYQPRSSGPRPKFTKAFLTPTRFSSPITSRLLASTTFVARPASVPSNSLCPASERKSSSYPCTRRSRSKMACLATRTSIPSYRLDSVIHLAHIGFLDGYICVKRRKSVGFHCSSLPLHVAQEGFEPEVHVLLDMAVK